MPRIVAEELKRRLVELSKTGAFKAVFWSMAKRRRALRETSVEAVYVSIQKDLDPGDEASQKIDEEILKLEELGIITEEQKKILTDAYEGLKKETVRLAKKNEVLATRESIINLFKILQEMGIGRYTRSYDRNKTRFEWNPLSCIDVGRMALFPKYLVETVATPERVVDMADGMLCCIVFSKEKKGKQWIKFLKKVRSWADEQIQAHDN
jgi:hypothetical protein